MESFRSFICEDSISSTESESDSPMLSSRNHFSSKRILEPSESRNVNKTKCLSKNALMARENRKKKKMYLESIEREAKLLREVNHELKAKNKKNIKTINSLKKEVEYLRNVISNSSTIERLLVGINKALNPKVLVKAEPREIHTSGRHDNPLLGDPFISGSSNISETEQLARTNQSLLEEDELRQVGICLHLNNGQLSLGLCPLCNNSSMDTGLFL